MINVTAKDVERLRSLARQVKEIAELPIQQDNKRLWQRVNDLDMERPVVYTRDYPLHIMHYGDELVTQIEDPFLRSLEQDLLMRIYEWNHLRCDRVIEPEIKCQCAIYDSGWGEELSPYKGMQGSGWKDGKDYEAKHFDKRLIEDMDDIEKIKVPTVEHDEAETERRYELMQEIFGGILRVRKFGKNYFRVVPWDDILTWIGLDDFFMSFYTEPEFMHALVKRYMECSIEWAKKYERLGLLSSNNNYDNILNNDPGYTTQLPEPPEEGIGCKLKDIWGATSDQILTSVSPDMTQEFAYDYEKPYSELFGLFGLGCCERLDQKVKNFISTFSNLRKVSSSPFTKLEPMLEQLGHDYTVCFKPNNMLIVGEDWEEAKRLLTDELKNALALCRKYNNNMVINMKSIITLNGEPQRLWWWCDMASKVVASEW